MTYVDAEVKAKFRKCVDLARRAVEQYGISDKLGRVPDTVKSTPEFGELRDCIVGSSALSESLLGKTSRSRTGAEIERSVANDIWRFVEWLVNGAERSNGIDHFDEAIFERRWLAIEWFDALETAEWGFVAPLINVYLQPAVPLHMSPWLCLRRLSDAEAAEKDTPRSHFFAGNAAAVEMKIAQPKQHFFLPTMAEKPVDTAVVALRLLKSHQVWPTRINSRQRVPFRDHAMTWEKFEWIDDRGVTSATMSDHTVVLTAEDEWPVATVWNRLWRHVQVSSELTRAVNHFVSATDTFNSDATAAMLKLWIAFEAIVLRERERNKRETAARRVAQAVAVTTEQHDEIYQLIRNSYALRSALVHGRSGDGLNSMFWASYRVLRDLLLETLRRGPAFLPVQIIV